MRPNDGEVGSLCFSTLPSLSFWYTSVTFYEVLKLESVILPDLLQLTFAYVLSLSSFLLDGL